MRQHLTQLLPLPLVLAALALGAEAAFDPGPPPPGHYDFFAILKDKIVVNGKTTTEQGVGAGDLHLYSDHTATMLGTVSGTWAVQPKLQTATVDFSASLAALLESLAPGATVQAKFKLTALRGNAFGISGKMTQKISMKKPGTSSKVVSKGTLVGLPQ